MGRPYKDQVLEYRMIYTVVSLLTIGSIQNSRIWNTSEINDLSGLYNSKVNLQFELVGCLEEKKLYCMPTLKGFID